MNITSKNNNKMRQDFIAISINKKVNSIIWTFLFLLLFLCGCNSKIDYVELKMPKMNPISYTFEASIDTIKAIIQRTHNHFPLKHLEAADDTDIVWGKEYLTRTENKADFYIYNLLPVSNSMVYIGKKEPVPYFYELLIFLKIIDNTHTQVEIKTINPRISVGVRFPYSVFPISAPDAAIIKPVQPSSIEEYMVLLVIGETLGVKEQMPHIILPEDPNKKIDH